MLRRFGVNFALLSIVLDALGTLAAFWTASWLRTALTWGKPLDGQLGVFYPRDLYAAGALVWFLIAFSFSLYDPHRTYKVVDEFASLGAAVLFYVLALAGLLYFTHRELSRLMLLYVALTDAVLLFGWRAIGRMAFRVLNWHAASLRRVLIVGAGAVGQQVAHMIQDYAWTGLTLVGYLDDDETKQGNGLPVLGTIDDACRVIEQERIEEVVIALPTCAYGRSNSLVAALHALPVNIRVVPDYFSLALYRATIEDFGGLPMISLRDPALNDVQRLFKRLFDLVVGGISTLAALPIMGLVALAIRLDSPGPILFVQPRAGENGRLIRMFKFRSMIHGADQLQEQVRQVDADGQVIYKSRQDPRITRVGRFIRRFSLDELPQLLNVLKGDLSLVGPRPEMLWLVQRYEPWQRKRFAVPQGLTGWWQVNGRADKPMYLHTEDDLYYIQNYSPWFDLLILFKTVLVVLRGKGAY